MRSMSASCSQLRTYLGIPNLGLYLSHLSSTSPGIFMTFPDVGKNGLGPSFAASEVLSIRFNQA